LSIFLQFDKIVRELKSTGAKMENLDIVVHLLLTLPKSYNNLITALETMDQEKLSLEFVKTRLMDEYNKRKDGNPNKSQEPGAINAKTRQLTCYGCGKSGHIKAKCRFKKKNKVEKIDPNNKKNSANEASNETQLKQSTMVAYSDREANACDSTYKSKCSNTNFQKNSTQHKHISSIKFVLDSGATQHMVNDERYFDELKDIDKINISVAKKNESLTAKQQGDIMINTLYEGDSSTKIMKNVLYVKDLKCNLMSIRSLTKKGYRIIFKGDYAYASIDNEIKFVACTNGRLYEVMLHVDKNNSANISSEENMRQSSQKLWHFRLGHLNARDMKKLVDRKMADGLSRKVTDVESDFCESCVFGRKTRGSFPPNKNARSHRILELIHTDVCGPMPTPAHDGSRYFVTFTDDFSRASMVYCIQRKSETLDKFKEFVAMVEALHGCKIAKLKADNGGEFTSNEFRKFCRDKGIQMMFTVPYNPEMNSVSERLNRTLQEKATIMLIISGLEKKFWNEAILTANYIKNRSPTSAVGKQFKDKTPAEIWFKQKPNLSHLKIFGSICYNYIPVNNRSKFEKRSTKCIFLGYTASMGSYRLWDLEGNKLVIGRHVTFDETLILNQTKIVGISDSEASTSKDDYCKSEETIDDEFEEKFKDAREPLGNSINEEDDDNIENKDNDGGKEYTKNSDNGNIPRRSERNRKAPDRYGTWDSKAHFALSAEQFVENDPSTIAEARQRDDWSKWKEAIDNEYHSLIKNKTWTLCELPKGRETVSCKWVFKLKRNANGEIDKYKARLVARGFSQKFGFNYGETYAPVAKLVTLRVLLAVANEMNMHIHQMDVKSAFFNGELTDEIYMQQPEGFNDNEKLVCKLNKSLYGLKQASRLWNAKFNDFMTRIGFNRAESDQCLYVRTRKEISCYILLYVDDLLIICSDLNMINTVKRLMSNEFEMTDVGKVNCFLGMHIEQDMEKGTISLSQGRYLRSVLCKFGMSDCKPIATPMEKGLHLEKGDTNENSNQPYRELIGCLTYATLTTRPDLCAATNYLSRFQSCFNETHYAHAKRILRYINGTIDMKMVYRRSMGADILVGYTDADWGGDKNDRKSTSGYVFKVFGNTVSWGSRKQSTVSLSSTEAEYIALAHGICEAKWIRHLLNELGIKYSEPTPIYEDNQSCIKVAVEPREHKRMKYVDIKYNFIRDEVAKGEVKIIYKATNEQIADIMNR